MKTKAILSVLDRLIDNYSTDATEICISFSYLTDGDSHIIFVCIDGADIVLYSSVIDDEVCGKEELFSHCESSLHELATSLYSVVVTRNYSNGIEV
jgi:hypothetical protein